MQVQFSKMQSLGNDFMIVDATTTPFSPADRLIQNLADRQQGVGFDQLLIADRTQSADADISCRIFNADGGEVAQCGNGIRCLARFARDRGLAGADSEAVCIATDERVMGNTFLPEGLVRTNMGQPVLTPQDIPFACDGDLMDYAITLNEATLHIAVLSFGNPHAIVQVDDVDHFAVAEVGAALQSHQCFPESVNVEFVQRIDTHHLKIRIYERGVGETKACGSGASAVTWFAVHQGIADSPLQVEMPGGTLTAEWDGSHLFLTGPTEYVTQDMTIDYEC